MFVKPLAVFGGVCAALCGAAAAQTGPDPGRPAFKGSGAAGRPVVVEMFLSQACIQSPPAAELLQSIAERPDVVALTWHVDYWDMIPAPGVGPWKDPFARPDFGARQMAYNQHIRGRAVKMTPQAVIDGVLSVAGSQRDAIDKRIVEAQFLDEMSRPTPPTLEIRRAEGNLFRTQIDNVGAPYDAVMVSFQRMSETRVRGGDNAGITFREANVVRAVSPIASAQSGGGDFTFAAPEEGLDCAVLVQERGNGRVVAARYCSDRNDARQ